MNNTVYQYNNKGREYSRIGIFIIQTIVNE